MRISFYKIYIISALIGWGLIMPAFTQTFTYTTDENTLNGAECFNDYLPLLKNKKVGIVANHTSMVGNTHLVDSLLSLKVQVVKIFVPEHGFRGTADAGEKISTSTDPATGLPVVSLYGKNKKPTADQLKDLDVVLFDLQDIGARFYTYISTMTYVMEACAENKKPIIVLDRPNPNGHYVDGPILEKEHSSFIGMHAIPVVHGMTMGEYAAMVNGEKWLANGVQADLEVIKIKNYDHLSLYQLPIFPSPNIKSMTAVYLYPTTCFFEGTALSIARGTNDPFTMAGHPDYTTYTFCFTPVSMTGAKEPKLMDKKCFGIDFKEKAGAHLPLTEIKIEWVIDMYKAFGKKEEFFTSFFSLLAGNTSLKEEIVKGMSAADIKATWKPGVDNFKKTRKKYLLYKDFED